MISTYLAESFILDLIILFMMPSKNTSRCKVMILGVTAVLPSTMERIIITVVYLGGKFFVAFHMLVFPH